MRVSAVAAVAALLALGVMPAAAQDHTLAPTYGEVTLAPGFVPDPFTVEVGGGGPVNAALLGADCVGGIAVAPDYRLILDGAAGPLIISVLSQTDTALVVRDPTGAWWCADDTQEIQPAVAIPETVGGQFDIWVGTFDAPITGGASLYISEIGTGLEYQAFLALTEPTGEPNPTLPPAYGEVTLAAGFVPDPYVLQVLSGGPINAVVLGSNCAGFIAEAPDLAVNYTAGTAPLFISALAQGDATLVVQDPAGNWYCDDDAGGNLQPLIAIEAPVTGRYLIWIGTYGEITNLATELRISGVPG